MRTASKSTRKSKTKPGNREIQPFPTHLPPTNEPPKLSHALNSKEKTSKEKIINRRKPKITKNPFYNARKEKKKRISGKE